MAEGVAPAGKPAVELVEMVLNCSGSIVVWKGSCRDCANDPLPCMDGLPVANISGCLSGGPPAVSELVCVSLSVIQTLETVQLQELRAVPPLCTMISCKGPQTRVRSRFRRIKYANILMHAYVCG